MLQALESRRMLTVTANLTAGVLNVNSDHDSDQVILATNDHGQIVVQAGFHHTILAVSTHDVSSINVNLGIGNDSLDTSAHINQPMNIHGGAGNDTVRAGSGHDMIFGDEGDDLIYSDDGVADNVDGGDGNDTAFVDAHDTVHNVEHVLFHHHALVDEAFVDRLTAQT